MFKYGLALFFVACFLLGSYLSYSGIVDILSGSELKYIASKPASVQDFSTLKPKKANSEAFKSESARTQLQDSVTEAKKKMQQIEGRIRILEKEEKVLEGRLERLGFPEVLNRDYLSDEERDEIFSLYLKKNNLFQEKLELLYSMVEGE